MKARFDTLWDALPFSFLTQDISVLLCMSVLELENCEDGGLIFTIFDMGHLTFMTVTVLPSLAPSLVHPTEFFFCFISGFLAIFVLLSSNSNSILTFHRHKARVNKAERDGRTLSETIILLSELSYIS